MNQPFDIEMIADKVLQQLVYNPAEPLIFSSGMFLWLFTAFLMVYVLLRRCDTARILFVICFSYYFYYKSSGFYFFLLAVVTISDYLIARAMAAVNGRGGRKCLVALSVAVNLGLLGYFKYTNFFGEVWAGMSGIHFDALDIFLPVGISFFTFQSLSYTIDVYRKKIEPLNSLLDYAFFVSFFPVLVAGPIVRAKDFIPQIRRPLTVTHDMLGQGVFLIVCGLFKKVIISDYISVNFVERIFADPSLYSGIENLMGAYGYTLQIYCDFSGYSDMAIGLGLLLGFHFNKNFDSPYKSTSITEFWRRWHISLSSWLKDYLYISLGGNRKGKFRQYLNLVITMLLGGLWHGASWNFVMWGMLHGVALALHKMWMSVTGFKVGERGGVLRRFVNTVVTFHFVAFCWIFFRNTDFNNSVTMIRQIAESFHADLFMQLIEGYRTVFVLMAVGYVLHFLPAKWENGLKSAVASAPIASYSIMLVVMIYCVIQMKSSEIQPFIYFQF